MDKISIGHGSGGKLSHDLINNTIIKYFKNPALSRLNDSANLKINKEKIAFTTDSYVVNPIFFKGGDIGKLSVCGTVNDLAMIGATPLFLSASCIIEAGFPSEDLEKILNSMKKAALEAKVNIVTGDTKVVETGKADKIFITTSGIGIIETKQDISGEKAELKDKIILSGTIADHGIAILSARENLKTGIGTDCAPLNHIIKSLLDNKCEIHVLRDPTRGGIATTLNEIANQSNVSILVEEDKIPLNKTVAASCELLGLDPLYIANEGKFIAFIPERNCDKALSIIKKSKYGKNAAIIGEIVKKGRPEVILKTTIGGKRVLDMLSGEQLPRIC